MSDSNNKETVQTSMMEQETNSSASMLDPIANDNDKDPPAMEQEPKPLTEFTIFPDLPPEIQLMCWKFAVPTGARRIKISLRENDGEDEDDVQLGANVRPSGLLSACINSRKAMKDAYTSVIKMSILGAGKLYFNADEDIILLGPRQSWEGDSCTSVVRGSIREANLFAEVKTLALWWSTAARAYKGRNHVTTLFPNLKVLLTLCRHPWESERHLDLGIKFVEVTKEHDAGFHNRRQLIAKSFGKYVAKYALDMQLPELKAMTVQCLDLDWI